MKTTIREAADAEMTAPARAAAKMRTKKNPEAAGAVADAGA